MAKFNEILVGRYNRLLQKLFQVKGTAPVPVLATEIQPQIQIFSGEENRYLEGWKEFGSAASIGPTALQVGVLQLRNPPGSNIIAVLEGVLVSTDQAQEIDFGYQTTNVDLAAVFAPIRFDARHGTTAIGSGLVSSAATNGIGALVTHRIRLLPNTAFQLINTDDQELPILPGDAFRIVGTVANSQIMGTFQYRERFLEESERT